MPPKRATNGTLWNLCEVCESYIVSKNVETHECPPNQLEHRFIRDNILYSTVDVRVNEEIKGLSQFEKDNLVFLTESVIQLLKLSIGDYAIITNLSTKESVIRTVWPSCEKGLTSVLLTKNGMDVSKLDGNNAVTVAGISSQKIKDANVIQLLILNAPRILEISNELLNRLRKSYTDKLVVRENNLSILFYGKQLKFQIKSVSAQNEDFEEDFNEKLTLDECLFKITKKTTFEIFKYEEDFKKEKAKQDPFMNIGGLNEEIAELKDLIDCALEYKPALTGFKTTRGVLIYGNPGTGKTVLSHALAVDSKATIVQINPADLYGKLKGSPEENIRELFKSAKEQVPSIILMDEVDILCPSRSSRMTDAEKKIVACMLTQFDELMDCKQIFVIGATNKPDSVDAAFRRCGRFEREIEIPVPNPNNRFDILKNLLPQVEEKMLKDLSGKTHGFVGADLLALSSRAALHASQQQRQQVNWDDFKFALTRVRPSAMREVQIEVPNVLWSDIGGQSKLKLILRQCVEWPLKHAESFIRMGITPPRGVLMYGPPGCSKTMIAKALATESGLNFLSIKGPELFSKWVGESERAVREVFRKARQVAPSIVFFDEIDALGGERNGGSSSVQERVLAQLLTELDGVTPLGDVTILAATNRPDRIDKALLRPGRLDRIVYVPLPDEATRKDIFRIKLAKMPTVDIDIDGLVAKTVGYSGAEVNAVCHEAAMMALEEDLSADKVMTHHFDAALDLITPRTPQSLLDIYDEYNKKS
ncbi:PREDICTED: spermatogenesis-associated protein 5 [Nicrophorus vespilloides]|uniref:Spermatogenesis-associated protein 5 n=1 Tax=Nicrophorus vespilloides TaxID=110193 RepID=A0ABM1MP47_NICVS|nr:PREDICTED: spermatogenesis-associated protein 5 [Nicrophorus vespilloides]